jgi:bacterioferritin
MTGDRRHRETSPEGVVCMSKFDAEKVIAVMNRILEAELAGVVRYTHYSFLVFGFGRIPIVSWLRGQANESLLHAQQVGEWITTLGAYPSLEIGPLLDSHQNDIAAMLRESLEYEGVALNLYRELLDLVQGRFVALEEFARQMIHAEEMHAAEVDKMLRKPGELASFAPRPG